MTAAYLQPYGVLIVGLVLPMISIVALSIWIERGEPSVEND